MRARKVDRNQTALRNGWLALGGSWLTIVPEHGGEPDALLGWRGREQLIEVKSPDGSPSARRARANQLEWHRAWKGRPVAVVETLAEMVALFP